MPYSRDQIRQNWVQLRQAIEKQRINMQRAAASDRNPDLTALQFLLRGFFVQLMRNQPGEIIYGGEPENGIQSDLVDFRGGAARINGRLFANKEAFLRYQAPNYVWAEDFFLSAGFDGLGIQPIYRFVGGRNTDPQAPFKIAQAVSVARLTCINAGHWERDGHGNAGAGNCGLYSAAQEVAANWPRIINWLDKGVSPFIPTNVALNGVKTKAQEHAEILQAQNLMEVELNKQPFETVLKRYLDIVKKPASDKDERELIQSLRDAVLIERPAAQGMPLNIQQNMRALIVPLLDSPSSALPSGYSAQKQAELHQHLSKILALHLERFPVEAERLRQKPSCIAPLVTSKRKSSEPEYYNPGTKAVSSLVTFCHDKFKFKKPKAPPVVAQDGADAQSRFDMAITLLNQYPEGWELAALQSVYEDAAREFGFTADAANNNQAKIMYALAKECEGNPALSKMLNFFLTDANPAKPATMAP